MNSKFRGTGVALVTPFKDDLTIDFEALDALVQHVTEGGVDYLVVMGTTAEAPTLSQNEKMEVLKYVKSVNHKNLPIIYGQGGNDTHTMVETFQNFQEEVDAFLVVCPYYNRPNQTGLKLHYEAVADAAKSPIILYNVPKRTGVNLEPNTVLELAKHPNIIGLKEASGSHVDQCEEIAKSMPADFVLTSGDDDLILPFIEAGGHGVISVIANALPKHTSRLVNSALENQTAQARETNSALEELLNLIFAEGNPTGIKALLSSMGIVRNTLRLPLVKASDMLYDQVKKAHSLMN